MYDTHAFKRMIITKSKSVPVCKGVECVCERALGSPIANAVARRSNCKSTFSGTVTAAAAAAW
jgi:hypothetical protein